MTLTSIIMNRFVLAGLASAAIIGAGFFWLANHDDAIRATVVAEYQPQIDQLEADVKEAQANVIFERDQAAKNSRAAQGYATERTVIYRQVEAAEREIAADIASGDLPNPAISPVKVATIDAIEELELQRAASEAR